MHVLAASHFFSEVAHPPDTNIIDAYSRAPSQPSSFLVTVLTLFFIIHHSSNIKHQASVILFSNSALIRAVQETVSAVETDCAKQREQCNAIIQQLTAITAATQGLVLPSVAECDVPNFSEWEANDWTSAMTR